MEAPFRGIEQPRLMYIIAEHNYTLYIPEGVPELLSNILLNYYLRESRIGSCSLATSPEAQVCLVSHFLLEEADVIRQRIAFVEIANLSIEFKFGFSQPVPLCIIRNVATGMEQIKPNILP
ncbi:unnamed protein product [Protopolystoma xenopodis]|uniref:Uncharacterized protein n=1 Tax=Protopolystoma xenopodis TaxID=117903 RepID=A0A3S5FH88_9PLAT|nr:unnamed protein product [Protopolystoma xenopodis]